MQHFFIARQPIVDRQESLVAFELLFRSPHGAATDALDDTNFTAQVVVNAFGEMGIADVLGAQKGFVNLNAVFLYSDLVEMLPRQKVVLELLETIKIDKAIIARCKELKAKGFSLALDDVVSLGDDIRPLLGIVDVVKLDLMQIDPVLLPGLVKELKKYPVQLLAEKVETREQALRCKEMGFDLFQGYHFAHPETLSGKRVSPSKIALLRIFTLMASDAESRDIEEAFKGHADLTYNLMRMVNSVGGGLITKIGSLSHGLAVLGRRALQRWVQLLLYASDQGAQRVNPLMQLAATRGKMMELIAHQERPDDRDYADRAFMVGMLSLLDVLMGEAMPDILKRTNLHEEVDAALLRREGYLGELLALCEQVEAGDVTAIEKSLGASRKLTVDGINMVQLEALGWAISITAQE